MTKICHITSAHKNTDTRIFQKECVSLAKKGYSVYLVAPGNNRVEKGVHVIGVAEKVENRLKRMIFTTQKVYRKSLEVNAEIYHLHDPELLPYGLKLKKKGKKVIFDSHEDYEVLILEKTYIPLFIRKSIQKIFNKYEKFVMRRMDAVIGVTPHLVTRLKKYNRNTVMITNYPIIDHNQINSNVADNEHKKNILFFAGGISEQWSHEMIIRILSCFDNVYYKIAGLGTQVYWEKLRKIEGFEKVEYLGCLPYEEVQKKLRNATIGLAILKYSNNTNGKVGTLGNTKIFEEMLAGIPVICTDFVLWKNLIEKHQCGICVNADNIEEIEKAIKWLVQHSEEARQMGKNGKEAVLNYYNWNTQEVKLYKIYKDLT